MTSHMESEANQHIGLISECTVSQQNKVGCMQSIATASSSNVLSPELSQCTSVSESHMTEFLANQKTLEACYQPVENHQEEM